MRNIFLSFSFVTILLLCMMSCHDRQQALPSSNDQLTLWADTIIYEVLVSNPDSLDEWETAKLKNVKQSQIIDDLFAMVYSGEKKAYDYYTHRPLSTDEVKAIEEDQRFSRKKVGKLQFTETWYFDKKNQKWIKKIHSVLLAYELYDDSNNLRGYKAAFVIEDF